MVDRFGVFIVVFALAYFLQEIGQTYMISVIQSIERQFQIPSKLTGFMVSASDIGYIPTVIFISYFGSKGNRAKWIGAGTLLVSCCYIMVSTPNFIFPVKAPVLNVTTVQNSLMPPEMLLKPNASLHDFLNYSPISDRIAFDVRKRLMDKVIALHEAKRFGRDDDGENVSELMAVDELPQVHTANGTAPHSLYTIDQPVIRQIMRSIDRILNGSEEERPLLNRLTLYALHRINNSESDIAIIRRAAIAPFSFCSRLVNDLKGAVRELKCSRKQSNFGPFVIIFTALVLLGIGKCTSWSLGMPLIDDNVTRKSSSLYFCGVTVTRLMGPICGFLVGSIANHLYFSFPAKSPSGLTPNDPTWIGAWWFGYLVVGILGIIPSLLLCFFPAKRSKVCPEKKEINLVDKHKFGDPDAEKKSFFGNYREVLASKVFLGSVTARVLDMFALRGYKSFVAKYLSVHYGMPQYKATTYVAFCITLMFVCGTVLGGIITRISKMNGRTAALFIVVVSTINCIGFGTKILLGCKSVVSQIGDSGRMTAFNYTNACNADCGCEDAQLYPVCDSTGFAYYSPCHAGCRDVAVVNPKTHELEFTNCGCVRGVIGGAVSKQNCHDDCSSMIILFFVASGLGAFVAGLGMVPGMLILIRSVPPATRSIALGLQAFTISLFGTLPSPVIWGALIDSACLIWEKTCGSRGACIIYDTDALRIKMHGIYACIRMVAVLADLFVLYHAKGLNIQEEEGDDEKRPPIEMLQMQDAVTAVE